MNLITNKNQLEFPIVEKTVCRGAYPNTLAEPHNLRPLHACPSCNKHFKLPQETKIRKSKLRFCSNICMLKFYKKDRKPFGFISFNKDHTGKKRRFISIPGHPSGPQIIYSRWVMEKKLKRFLKPGDIVHHINGNQLDDRIENLRVFKCRSDHHKNHFPSIRAYSEEDRKSIIDIIFDSMDIYNPFPNIPRNLYY